MWNLIPYRSLSCAAAALAVGLLILTGCGGGGVAPRTCTSNANCAAEEICTSGVCTPSSAPKPDAGRSDRSRPGTDPEGECSIDIDCGEGQICEEGACVDDTGSPGDAGQPKPAGCKTDSNCSGATPRCETKSEKCVACLENDDCEEGNACDPAAHKCIPEGAADSGGAADVPAPPKAKLGEKCKTGDACESGVCHKDTCRLKDGEDCKFDDDCQSEICRSGKCASKTPPDAGQPDAGTPDAGPADAGPTDTGPADTGPADTGPADTGPADTGPADTGPADTGPPTDSGSGECKAPADCPFTRPVCQGGKCVCNFRSCSARGEICNTATGDCEAKACAKDGDCPTRHICEQNKCIAGCESAQDCGQGQQCDIFKFRCSGGSPTIVCGNDSQCQNTILPVCRPRVNTTTKTWEGRCEKAVGVVGPGGRCVKDADCQTGYCFCNTGDCANATDGFCFHPCDPAGQNCIQATECASQEVSWDVNGTPSDASDDFKGPISMCVPLLKCAKDADCGGRPCVPIPKQGTADELVFVCRVLAGDKEAGEACTQNRDCKSGICLNNKFCFGLCESSQDCKEGTCQEGLLTDTQGKPYKNRMQYCVVK